MSPKEFTDKYLHRIGGMVAEAATTKRQGHELSMMLYNDYAILHKMLAEMHADLVPSKAPPVATSAPAPQPPKR